MEVIDFLWDIFSQGPSSIATLIQEWLGMNVSSNDIKIAIPTIIISFIIIYFIYKWVVRKRKIHRWHLAKIEEKLGREFASYNNNKKTIFEYFKALFKDKDAVDIYIETRFQNNPPYEKDEPKENGFSEHSESLIRFYLDRVLIPENNTFFLYCVLAGSGMGKTTFAINLLKQYIFKYTEDTLPYDIYLLSLLHNDTLNKIEKIEKKEHSILILDGLDENNEAVRNFALFKEKLETLTQNFRFLIITCRTQFFSTKDDELKKSIHTHYYKGNRTFEHYHKQYISVFNNKDIVNYLKQKYHRINNRKKAEHIVSMCNLLMVRPLLLSYIDDLLQEEEENLQSSLDLYRVLIDKWLCREVEFWASSNPHLGKVDKLKQSLCDFSQDLAVHIYQRRDANGGLFISRENLKLFMLDKKITMDYRYTGRSLVNRDSEGNVKFAHKSFLEYFLALQKFQGDNSISFEGMDLAKEFYKMLCTKNLTELKKRSIINFDFDSDTIRLIAYRRIDKYLHNFDIISNNIEVVFLPWDVVTESLLTWLEQHAIQKLVIFDYNGDGNIEILLRFCLNHISLVVMGEYFINYDLNIELRKNFYYYIPMNGYAFLSSKEEMDDILLKIRDYHKINDILCHLEIYGHNSFDNVDLQNILSVFCSETKNFLDKELEARCRVSLIGFENYNGKIHLFKINNGGEFNKHFNHTFFDYVNQLCTSNKKEHNYFVRRDVFSHLHNSYKSVLACPIKSEKDVLLGFLYVDCTNKFAFSETTIYWVQLLANGISLLIEKWCSFQECLDGERQLYDSKLDTQSIPIPSKIYHGVHT